MVVADGGGMIPVYSIPIGSRGQQQQQQYSIILPTTTIQHQHCDQHNNTNNICHYIKPTQQPLRNSVNDDVQ